MGKEYGICFMDQGDNASMQWYSDFEQWVFDLNYYINENVFTWKVHHVDGTVAFLEL